MSDHVDAGRARPRAFRSVRHRLLAGTVAGAAGTTALHAATHLDMVLRGRPASRTPQQTVEAVARSAGLEVPGRGERREHRLEGLGALSGTAVGVLVGLGYAVLDVLRLQPGSRLGRTAVAGGLAMVAGNAGLVRYGVSDPRTWSPADWLSDLVPHVAYGACTAGAYAVATERVRTRRHGPTDLG